MPPKSLKKKIPKPNQQNQSSSSSNVSHNYPPPSFFNEDSNDDFTNQPFDLSFNYSYGYDYENYDGYTYEDFDDYSNPFDPSHHTFIKEEQKPTFTFPVVENLEAFIKDGGEKRAQALMKLPLDIFLDIISRLPIKPLAVCRCVCKTWGTIVHHPRFGKLHNVRVSQEPLEHTRVLVHVSASLLFELKDDEENGQVFSEIVLVENDKDDSIEKGVVVNPQFMPAKVHIKNSDLKYEVLGSCNGLVILGDPVYFDPIYVCNPVIGEYMSIPPSYKRMRFEIVCGIGFDQVANEYKVVRAIFNFRDLECIGEMEAEVYTLGSNKWRKLGKFLYPYLRRSSQVFVKRALHWMAAKDCASDLIIAFDVAKEEFQVVPAPYAFAQTNPEFDISELLLGELGGCLCLLDQSFDVRFEIWVMKEYGVKDSWTKEYVISKKVSGFTEEEFKPLKLMTNGNILLVVNSQFVVCYDPKKKRFRKLKIHLPPKFDAITHVGSLVSLRDFVVPTTSKHCVNTGGWYGDMKSVTSNTPEFDVEGWKLNEQMRRLWFESH